jgi:hypothetical protein
MIFSCSAFTRFSRSGDPLFVDLELIECRRLTAYSSGKETPEPKWRFFLFRLDRMRRV